MGAAYGEVQQHNKKTLVLYALAFSSCYGYGYAEDMQHNWATTTRRTSTLPRQATAAVPTSSGGGRIAVMLVGLIRVWRTPMVVQHHYNYLERALQLQGETVDSYLCTENNTQNVETFTLINSSWPSLGHLGQGKKADKPDSHIFADLVDGKCKGEDHSCAGFERRKVCLDHVFEEERKLRVTYAWFVTMRPDAIPQQPFPRISGVLDPSATFGQAHYCRNDRLSPAVNFLHVGIGSVPCVTLWDGLGVVPRSHAAGYFSNTWRGMREPRTSRPRGWISANEDEVVKTQGCQSMVAPQRSDTFKKWAPEGVLTRQVLEIPEARVDPNLQFQAVLDRNHDRPNSPAFVAMEKTLDACLRKRYPSAEDIIMHRTALPRGCSPTMMKKGQFPAQASFDHHKCSCDGSKGWKELSTASARILQAQYTRYYDLYINSSDSSTGFPHDQQPEATAIAVAHSSTRREGSR